MAFGQLPQGEASARGARHAFGHAHIGGTPPSDLGNAGGLGGPEGAHARRRPRGRRCDRRLDRSAGRADRPGSSGVHALPVTGAGALAVPASPAPERHAGTDRHRNRHPGRAGTDRRRGRHHCRAGTDRHRMPARRPCRYRPAPATSLRPASAPPLRSPDRTPVEAEARPARREVRTPPSAAQRSAAASSRQLPFTGADLPLLALLGATALAAGVVLRRRPAAR